MSKRARNARPRDAADHTPGLPGSGPGLPPTAQRLLDAARRLLARSGYNSLTVDAIGREAGENKALVRYYFGSKDGLLIALVDGLISDTLWQTRQRLAAVSSRQDRSHLVVETAEAILDDAQSYRLLFDLLPRLLEHPSMARRLAELYQGYRDLNTQALWGGQAADPPETVRNAAAMTIALTDGLAVQLLAQPGSVEAGAVFAAWQTFIEGVLASASDPDAEPARPAQGSRGQSRRE